MIHSYTIAQSISNYDTQIKTDSFDSFNRKNSSLKVKREKSLLSFLKRENSTNGQEMAQ